MKISLAAAKAAYGGAMYLEVQHKPKHYHLAFNIKAQAIFSIGYASPCMETEEVSSGESATPERPI